MSSMQGPAQSAVVMGEEEREKQEGRRASTRSSQPSLTFKTSFSPPSLYSHHVSPLPPSEHHRLGKALHSPRFRTSRAPSHLLLPSA